MRNNGNLLLQNLSIIASLSLSLLLHHLIICLAVSNSPPSDIPDLNYVTLACGLASDTKAPDGRTWTADTNSKFFSSQQNNASSAVESPPSKFVTDLPYTTARISRYPFTYIFPAETLHMEAFFREFWLKVEDDRMLNLTFIPSFGTDDVYAFINGIEMASISTNYYTAADNPGLKFLGQNKPVGMENKAVLQLTYRINVGGAFLSPLNDCPVSKLDSDDEYLTVAKPSALSYNSTIQLRYTIFTRFAAPDPVYVTERSMGMDKKVNENYNLTWEFQVDLRLLILLGFTSVSFSPQ
ncbi:hypothetical protein GH714_031352 [Hevea brasiliensis]|uniref:Malectin-like domain-containing protein n=1 Tax=Hevea brasiliensis TaxID=3981 RepID=A0A6A6LCZ3_HEVBR|nr:hypothetical protein GH714_031352 [Hevea brasiliensis]